MKSTLTRNICRLLIVMMAWMPYQIAQAGMIGTDQAVASAAQSERAALLNLVSRSDVASQLQALGVDPASAKERVAAMTDEELRTLAGQINSLPAGADSGGVLLLIVIVLIIWWAWKR